MRQHALIIFAAFVIAAAARPRTQQPANARAVETATGPSFADVAQPKPGTWPTYNGNLSGNRFSALDQINASTVRSLTPKWMFTIHGAPRPLQMTPLVVDGVMY